MRARASDDQTQSTAPAKTIAPPRGYAAQVRAMTDSEFEEEVVTITGAAARWSVYNVYDAMAQVLLDDRKHRPDGDAIYARGHRRMQGAVQVERAVARAVDFVETGR